MGSLLLSASRLISLYWSEPPVCSGTPHCKQMSDMVETAKAPSDDKETAPAPTEEASAKAAGPDAAVLKSKFVSFSKFGDKAADGATIKLSQSDKWFKQAGVIAAKGLSTTDTGIAFKKVSKNAPKLSFQDWNRYLDEIANTKKLDVNSVKTKLVDCGEPGFTGETKVAKNAALDRLTDTSRYGATHRERFDSSGKGKGKEGRVDKKSDGYVQGYKGKKEADAKMKT